MSGIIESRGEIVYGFYEIESMAKSASDLRKSHEVDLPAHHASGAGEVRERTSHRPYSSVKGETMIHGIIDDLCKTLSELRKKLRSAGFANAETLVPQQGVGQGVIYAFCVDMEGFWLGKLFADSVVEQAA